MSEIVTITFDNEHIAAAAINDLIAAGIPVAEISVLHSSAEPGHEFALRENRKVAEGAAVGGVTGGALGGALLGIAGLAAISIPPLGVFAAGPLFAALAGAGGGGAIGGIVGALIGAGIPEHEAVMAGTRLKHGAVLVAVRAHPNQVAVAKEVFHRHAKATPTPAR